MTVSHEREPTELGYVARYSKLVNQLEATVRSDPDRYRPDQVEVLGRGGDVESEMLRLHVRRRLSERLDGVKHGPEGSIDKLLMTRGPAGGRARGACGRHRDPSATATTPG